MKTSNVKILSDKKLKPHRIKKEILQMLGLLLAIGFVIDISHIGWLIVLIPMFAGSLCDVADVLDKQWQMKKEMRFKNKSLRRI